MNEILTKYFNYIPFVLIGLVFSLALTPFIIKLALKLDAVSKPKDMRDPSERGYITHINDKIIPKLGFLSVIIPIVLICPFFIKPNFQYFTIFISLIGLSIFGIFDDKYNVSGKLQFLILSFFALLVILTGTNITEANNPFNGSFINFERGNFVFILFNTKIAFSILSIIITYFWIMVVTNAINWSDGVDGVLNGVTSISTLIILLVSIRYNSVNSAVISSVFLGANLGMLKYNFFPAKIFNSYGGQIYGFLLAVLAITGGVKLSIAILALIFPIFDFAWVLWGRIKRNKPKTPGQLLSILNVSDITHLHHRFLALGFSTRKVAYTEYILAAGAGLISIFLSGLELTFLIFSSLFLVLLIFIILDRIIKRRDIKE